MDKIDERMARFVELSMKFSKNKEDIKAISKLNELAVSPEKTGEVFFTTTDTVTGYGGGITLTSVGSKEELKTLRKRVEEGVTNLWTVHKEYEEYIFLQGVLNTYFEAKKEVNEKSK